ncbi:MAG: prohibitin family protein [Flavobacteriales bacterium]|nr:prohibitin family protein [Flavobacteriales bacterium]
MKKLLFFFLAALLFSGCVVVRQDQVAVKRRFGKLVGEPVREGTRLYNPFVATYIKVPVRTVSKKIDLEIPSKEGLTIKSEMSILYRVDPNQIQRLLREVGVEYEEDLIAPVFRSALADVSARFMAKDMHTGERTKIEKAVQDLMMTTLEPKGIIIERVLMKRIVLPASLTAAIEAKLAAEQDAQRMQFILDREKQEAERKKIEAQGTADAQKILSNGLTDAVLRYQMIQAFEKLAESENAKVIITDGKTPLMLNED